MVRRIALLVVLIIGFVAVLSAQETFTSLDGRITLTVPAGWEVEEDGGLILLEDEDRNFISIGLLSSDEIERAQVYYADTLGEGLTADTLLQLLADVTPEINANIESELGFSLALPGTNYEGPVEIAGLSGASGAFGITPVLVLEAETGDFLLFNLDADEAVIDSVLEPLVTSIDIQPFSLDTNAYTTAITPENAADLSLITQYVFGGGATRDIEVLPDGASLVVGASGEARHIEIATGAVLQVFDFDDATVTALDLSADGSQVVGAAVYRDDRDLAIVRVWDAATGDTLATITTTSDESASLVRISPDGSLVGVVGGRLMVYDVATGDEVLLVEGERDAFAFNAAGTQMVAACPEAPGTVACVYDLASGDVVTEIANPDNAFPFGYRSLAFFADTVLVGFSQFNGPADVVAFSAASGDPIFTAIGPENSDGLTAHEGAVTWIALNADGSLMVTAGDDESIRLWDVASGAGIAVLEGPHGSSIVNRAAFNPDGTLLFTTANDGTLRVWAIGE